jgi:hypothetical protein
VGAAPGTTRRLQPVQGAVDDRDADVVDNRHHPHLDGNSLDADAPDWGLDDLEPLPPPVPPSLRITPLTAGCGAHVSGAAAGTSVDSETTALGSLARRRSSSSGSGLGLGLVPLTPTESGTSARGDHAPLPATHGHLPAAWPAHGSVPDAAPAPTPLDVAAEAAAEHKRLLAAHARTETGRPEDDLPPPLTGFSAFQQQDALPFSVQSPTAQVVSHCAEGEGKEGGGHTGASTPPPAGSVPCLRMRLHACLLACTYCKWS